MKRPHFFLKDQVAATRSFTPPRQSHGDKELPSRDRVLHANMLKSQYEEAVSRAISVIERRTAEGLPVADGVYVNIDMDKNFVPGKPLGQRSGATVMKVAEKVGDEDNYEVTVYIKEEKKDWLATKAEAYATKETPGGKPRNNKFIAPINEVSATDISSLYVSAEAFKALPDGYAKEFEVWVHHAEGYSAESTKRVFEQSSMVVISEPLCFESVDIWLVRATKQQLTDLPYALGSIESVRPYYQPSVLVKSHDSSRQWSELFKDMVVNYDDTSNTIVGILDTGVNNRHELLATSLPDERMVSVVGTRGVADEEGHGTGMAGLALLGDFTPLAYTKETVVDIHHSLASVKIMEKGYVNDFYGVTIEQGVSAASDMGASIQCMAVTDEDSYDGMATSSSAALDESIYHGGECDRLVVVSAGNIQPDEVDCTDYIESCKANAIQSPAQAWNALTVGAYTQKDATTESDYSPLSLAGGLSPLSRSSYPWKQGQRKPEILMEGGNVAYHNLYKATTPTDFCLITTSSDLGMSLEEFNGTSAATALATRLAARIKVANPDLSMLSVRGLMVHSAEWTDEMMHRISNLDDRMSLCGYGVPDEDKAIHSNDRCATFIFENAIIPYKSENGKTKYNEMHYYDIPWPTQQLVQMGNEDVRIRITLSYYIEPSPSNSARVNRYRYPSATLHFDLKTATETEDEFLRRRNQEEGERIPSNGASRWQIKQLRRERGTVQSDWICCKAIELAEMDKIVVWPGQGWWKDRKLENVDNSIPYSLIVSIETAKTDIYNAVETAISNRIGITIAQEV